MRHLLIATAVVACLATSLTFAQGRPGGAGGGPPSGAGMGGGPGGMSGSMSGGRMGGPSIDMRGSADARRAEAQVRRDLAVARRAEAAARRHAAAANAQTPEQAAFGLATAERAKTLKDADDATREAFGPEQSELAEGQGRGQDDAGDGDE